VVQINTYTTFIRTEERHMAKPTSDIFRQVLLRLDYRENSDDAFTHPYERKLETSPLEPLRRKIRLGDRPRR